MNSESSARNLGGGSYFSWKTFLKTIFLVGMFFVLCGSVFGLTKKYIALRKSIAASQEEQRALLEKKQKLEEKTALLGTELGTEMALRDKYRIVKPNEGMVILADDRSEEPAPPKSRMVRFWDMITSIFH